MNQLLIAIILTVLPITELRIGMPLAINYAINNSIPIIAIAILIILINILTIFAIYFFLEYIHKKLEKIKIYRRGFELWMSRIRKKVDKIEKKGRMGSILSTILIRSSTITRNRSMDWDNNRMVLRTEKEILIDSNITRSNNRRNNNSISNYGNL